MLFSVLVLICVIFVGLKLFISSKQRTNFFTSACIKPPGPIITNRIAKKKILKQRKYLFRLYN